MFDLTKIPFSRYGSYFVFSEDADTTELFLRDVHGGDEAPSKLFKIEAILDGKVVPVTTYATETELVINSMDNNGHLSICMSEPDLIHIHGSGLGIRLTAIKTKYDNVLQYQCNKWEFHFYSKEIKLMMTCMKGNAVLDAPWKIIGNEFIVMEITPDNGSIDIVIESYKTVWEQKQYCEYTKAKETVEAAFKDWNNSLPIVPKKYSSSRKLASYITWSSVVHAEGRLTRDAMFMSKNWMYNIWSWDNCFNAIMLAKSHPQLALEQLLVFVDNQDESGIYPDFINDRFSSFSCCKPPIHAWAFKRMREMNSWFNEPEIIKRMYDSFSKVTGYWLKYRRKALDSLPVYNHGNDSGWDNASIFHFGVPIEAPDLAAHLIRQMDILSEMALELSLKDQASEWKKESNHMYDLMMERLVLDNSFYAFSSVDNIKIEHNKSLLLRMPIVIGYRLSESIKSKLIKDLKTMFESDFGLATEAFDSCYYKEDGYWLGPIWAPVMYLIVDALKDCGYEEKAKDYARRFCDATLIGGMAENFDPLTGKGLVDPAFTWTSSVFLLLASEFI